MRLQRPTNLKRQASSARAMLAGGLLFMVLPAAADGLMTVHFPDAGQADATIIEVSDYRILIDAGRSFYDLPNALQAQQRDEIDLAVATHAHADHIGGFAEMIDQGMIDTLWYNGQTHTTVTFERFTDAIWESERLNYVEPQRGDAKEIGPLRVEVLHPEGSAADYDGHLHDKNIVVRVDYHACSALIAGDIEKESEREMINQGLNLEADLLELGHHGSRTSSDAAFLQAVDPLIAVAQYAEGNEYGHPHGEVIDRVANQGAYLYGTGAHGEMSFYCTPEGEWSATVEQDMASVVPGDRDDSAQTDEQAHEGCIDLNEASADQLARITHIGPARAAHIKSERPWEGVHALEQINGLGESRVADIKTQGKACVE